MNTCFCKIYRMWMQIQPIIRIFFRSTLAFFANSSIKNALCKTPATKFNYTFTWQHIPFSAAQSAIRMWHEKKNNESQLTLVIILKCEFQIVWSIMNTYWIITIQCHWNTFSQGFFISRIEFFTFAENGICKFRHMTI